jgi:hypothetical protein
VERTFSSINTLFAQHVAGYTGSHTGERGRDTEGEAVWTLAQLEDLLQEWIVCGWQAREHDGLRHPMMPRRALSPNEMWAALVAVCGYVPVPLGREDYIELMPVRRQKINDYGIRIDYRTYDHQVLNPHRGEPSPAADGLWDIHYNPHSPGQVWVRLPDPGRPQGYGWQAVPWIHRTLVTAPFTDFTWQHVRRTVAQRGNRVNHEHDLALALRELLERAAAGHGTPRDKVVAARARAHGAANADGGVWGILYGQQPAGVPEPDDDDEDEDEDVFADDGKDEDVDETEAEAEEPCADDGAVGIRPAERAPLNGPLTGPAQEADVPAAAPVRVTVYDPFEESLRW